MCIFDKHKIKSNITFIQRWQSNAHSFKDILLNNRYTTIMKFKAHIKTPFFLKIIGDFFISIHMWVQVVLIHKFTVEMLWEQFICWLVYHTMGEYCEEWL